MKLWRMAGLLLLVVMGVGARAQTQGSDTAGKAQVADAFGPAQKRIGDASAKWETLNVGDLLPLQTVVRTGDNAAVLLVLPDKHIFRIGAQSYVGLKTLGKDKAFSFSVLTGKIWSFVRKAAKPTRYEVETPSAVVGVTGTVFSVFHDAGTGETTVSTDEGTVQAQQNGGSRFGITKGYFASLSRNAAQPAQAVVQSPGLQQMWTLVRSQENWTREGVRLKLSRQIEQNYRLFAPRHQAGGRRPFRQSRPRFNRGIRRVRSQGEATRVQ